MKTARRWLAELALVCIVATFGIAKAAPPTVTSANLSAHFDASDINNDGGGTNPGNGGNVNTWTNRIGGANLNNNFPTDGLPTFVSAGNGGIGNQDTVRFDATAGGGDLLFNNAMNFNAQTIYSVLTMPNNASGGLSTLLGNSANNLNIRQTTSDTAAYFSGNSGDFLLDNSTAASGGTFSINGNRRLDIPGGFGAEHVVRTERTTATAYSGFRLSSNVVANRRWNGDIGEILVYDGTLSGDDTLSVQQYLTGKYGVQFNTALDERINESKQVAIDPFQGTATKSVAVNFHYSGPEALGTFNGIGFDNIDLAAAGALTNTFVLTANADTAGTTLTLNLPFTSDNSQRTQNANITGTDAATLNAVFNELFYLSNGGNHPSADMLFEGLAPNEDVFVQVFGGDDNWNGDIQVLANGADVFDWLGAADGGNTDSASLFGFYTQADANGDLDLLFTVPNGNFAGIGGVLVSQTVAAPVPEPASIAMWTLLGVLGLTGFYWRRKR